MVRGSSIRLVLAATVVFAAPAAPVSGAESADPADRFARRVAAAMKKAGAFWRSIATHGGWCGIYSADLKQRWGEADYHKATRREIWVQPPGTPTIGRAFLRAARVTGDADHLAAARQAGLALAWGQRTAGGWDYLVRVDHAKPPPAAIVRKSGRCTFDDNTSQAALTFLMDLDETIDETWCTEAVTLGLKHLLAAQRPNGAWPQNWPLVGGYHDYHTFNDNVINDCIAVCLRAHRQYRQGRYLRAAKRGGDFIIASAVSAAQPGWAQQYDLKTKPAWGRAFEPPGVCSAATARNIRTLIDLYRRTADKKYLKPIGPAIRWLRKSQIAKGRWARLYEVGTNKPIYGDRDRKIHYRLDEISAERRSGYAWQGSFGVPEAIRAYGRVLLDAKKPKPATAPAARPPRVTARQVESIIDAMDPQGRWVRGRKLHAADFVRNFSRLTDYLAARPQR